MSQSLWTYYDPSHGTQTVGIYHGDDSGNLVVYCNNEVVMIDFEVKHTKTYSFYINQCLIEIKITKKAKGFDIEFSRTMPTGEIKAIQSISSTKVFFICTLILLGIISMINMFIFAFFM